MASTLWHELGHAILELADASNIDEDLLPKSPREEEDWVEEMAHTFWKTGSISPEMEKIVTALS